MQLESKSGFTIVQGCLPVIAMWAAPVFTVIVTWLLELQLHTLPITMEEGTLTVQDMHHLCAVGVVILYGSISHTRLRQQTLSKDL